ncbi:MAG: hypothetical protein ACHQII_07770, partial [Bacteroidia bacterium]
MDGNYLSRMSGGDTVTLNRIIDRKNVLRYVQHQKLITNTIGYYNCGKNWFNEPKRNCGNKRCTDCAPEVFFIINENIDLDSPFPKKHKFNNYTGCCPDCYKYFFNVAQKRY